MLNLNQSNKHHINKSDYWHHHSSSAFTIVELLVVIIIIAVLATIILVSYTNISRQAVVSSMQSDLSNASTALKAFQVETGNFPTTISTNCSTNPDSQTNKCLKVSGGNSYSNYVYSNGGVPKSFSLTVSNPGLTYSYIVTAESKPASLAPAPNNPTADWLATTQGDHYGNYYDLVGKTWATVTRAGSKTVYDPTTQHIYDVPANYLAVTPRSDGKSGVEAIVEEGRTNYLTNSDGESTLGNPAWYNNNWGGSTATVTQDTSSSVHGSTSVKFATTNWVDNSFSLVAWNNNLTATVPMTSGLTYTYSIYGKVVSGSATYRLQFQDTNGNTQQDIVLTDRWQRFSVTRTLGAGVTNIILRVYALGANQVSLWDGAQVETGSFATSYIPTTATTVTRNTDTVTVPTTSWNISAGVFITTLGKTSWNGGAAYARMLSWSNGSDTELFTVCFSSQTGLDANTRHGGAWGTDATATGFSLYGAVAYRYDSSSQKHRIFLDGVGATEQSITQYPSGLQATAGIGMNSAGGSYINGPIQRLTVYNSALSDSNISTATNSIKDGPQ